MPPPQWPAMTSRNTLDRVASYDLSQHVGPGRHHCHQKPGKSGPSGSAAPLPGEGGVPARPPSEPPQGGWHCLLPLLAAGVSPYPPCACYFSNTAWIISQAMPTVHRGARAGSVHRLGPGSLLMACKTMQTGPLLPPPYYTVYTYDDAQTTPRHFPSCFFSTLRNHVRNTRNSRTHRPVTDTHTVSMRGIV